MTIENDLRQDKIDMAILWGPMAGYLISNSPPGTYSVHQMLSTPGMKFDFPISMGVRYGDKARKEQLNKLIAGNGNQIVTILQEYNVPLVDETGQLLFLPGKN